jgi:hypothetical protein
VNACWLSLWASLIALLLLLLPLLLLLQSALVGAMDIAFAFGGQINWMRYITTMRQRNKFAAAASLTTGAQLSRCSCTMQQLVCCWSALSSSMQCSKHLQPLGNTHHRCEFADAVPPCAFADT